jgi:hypothetical protein
MLCFFGRAFEGKKAYLGLKDKMPLLKNDG